MFNKLKALFVVEDENSKTAKPPVVEKKEKVESAAEVAVPSSEDIEVEPGAKPTAKFVNVLMKAIDEANQKGFDYLEYKQSLQSLSGIDMNVETQYQSALAMAKTMGASADSLIKSAAFYQDILKREDAKFQTALQQQMSKQITGRKTDLQKYEQVIIDKKKMIEKLTKEIAAHEAQLKKLKTGMSGAQGKLENTRKGFAIAYHTVFDQIDKDIQQMKKIKS